MTSAIDHTPPTSSAISEIRSAPSFSIGHRVERLAFKVCWVVFARWTPKHLKPIRLIVLRLFGAKIGKHSDVRSSVKVWYPRNLSMGESSVLADDVEMYNMDHVTIGDRVVISQRAFICGGTHDYRDLAFPLVTRPISIESDVWIASEAFVGPGVTIGRGAVLGARAVAARNLAEWGVYSGNPSVLIKNRSHTSHHV